ncbi:MAG: hypothetical protein ABI597_08455 [Gammaproteobacteria bacterium]
MKKIIGFVCAIIAVLVVGCAAKQAAEDQSAMYKGSSFSSQ